MVQNVTTQHLTRLACLYVRQSTLKPHDGEYGKHLPPVCGCRERARALGWAEERIVVIDQDLRHSEASTADRLGFQRLLAEVGLGHVGLVMSLEVSRLARNSSDWHQLLEICALTHTLILDEERLDCKTVYNLLEDTLPERAGSSENFSRDWDCDGTGIWQGKLPGTAMREPYNVKCCFYDKRESSPFVHEREKHFFNVL